MENTEILKSLKEFKGLVLRADLVSFMEVKDKYYRMKGFTELPRSKEVQEYSRQYVDEYSERTSSVGMTETIDYTFDKYKDNPVHERIIEITDKELLADDATVNIVVVDFSKDLGGGKFYARKRNYTVVPDTDGDGTEAYQYSGSFTANGKSIEGYITASEDSSDILTIEFKDGEVTEEGTGV
ncbi:hypothetical protein [uncultured Anaerococcus sp.]|uniref:hypothetical protein n=1 Tax=uncultured Anaerococcus sp. TaxID=293428 RepID=UPI00260F9962|nr:hypothetical protein [uncultured Anaerococcus sp.]